MATSFSPTASVGSIIFQNPPKGLLLLSQQQQQRSFASSASYATLKLPRAFALSPRPLLSKGRTTLVRAATIEEIEAEKAAIEKDAVINFSLSLALRPSIL